MPPSPRTDMRYVSREGLARGGPDSLQDLPGRSVLPEKVV
jgi:hypothetical protein